MFYLTKEESRGVFFIVGFGHINNRFVLRESLKLSPSFGQVGRGRQPTSCLNLNKSAMKRERCLIKNNMIGINKAVTMGQDSAYTRAIDDDGVTVENGSHC